MAVVERGQVIRDDVAWYDGVTRTASRKDATGGTVTGLNFGDEVDVLQVFGSGTNRTVSTINDAVTRLGGANATLRFSTGTWTIDSDLTIPSNCTSHIPAGCVFNVSAGKTLTFSGKVLREHTTFTSGSGTVTGDGSGLANAFYDTVQDETDASVTPKDFTFSAGHLKRYGATLDGTADDGTAVTDWINVGLQGTPLTHPGGTALCTTWTKISVATDLLIYSNAQGILKATSSDDFLQPAGGDIRVRGITFDTWRQVLENDAADSGTTDVLDVRRCKFLTMANSPIDHERPVNRVWIESNEFDAITNHCIRIGRDTNSEQDTWQRIHISKNTANNIDATGSNDASFCLIYGKRADIEGNIIEDIDTVDGECWGIYTKCRYANIRGNNINDLSESGTGAIYAINIKGSDRAASTSPQGFAVVCSGNTVLGAAKGSGIRIQQEDVLCEGNYVENFIISIDGGTAVAYRNQAIQNNLIICADKLAGTYGINLIGEVDSINCTGNLIYQGYHGIRGASATGSGSSNWNVSGNTIRDCGNIALNFDNTTTLTGLMIHNNIVDGATRVVFVDTADEVSIKGNKQTNITDAVSLWYNFGTPAPSNMEVDISVDLQTTGATNTVAASLELPDNTAAILSHEVVAMESDGTDRAMYSKKGLFYRDGGNATQQGSTQDVITDEESDANWTATLGVSSNDLLARVTGASATTINWRCHVTMQTVN